MKNSPPLIRKQEEMNDKTLVEDHIEEDINPNNDLANTNQSDDDDDDEYELYQAPISGGIPIRLQYTNDLNSSSKRPFTPPF